MTKAEHNKILDGLLGQLDMNRIKSEIIRMAHMIAKADQLDLMEELITQIPYSNPDYEQLTEMVNKAVADAEK
jgi:hypothetical protein